jgi:hypothetical protein
MFYHALNLSRNAMQVIFINPLSATFAYLDTPISGTPVLLMYKDAPSFSHHSSAQINQTTEVTHPAAWKEFAAPFSISVELLRLIGKTVLVFQKQSCPAMQEMPFETNSRD